MVCVLGFLAGVLVVGASARAAVPVQDGAAAQALRVGSVKIELDQAGVGGVARAGSYAGIRLRLTDTATRQREVVVRLTMPDADRDVQVWTRAVSLNPGVAQPVWIYTMLPYAVDRDGSFTISVHAAEEGGLEAAMAGRFGELLGQVVVAPQSSAIGRAMNILPPSAGLWGRIGVRSMGLDRFLQSFAGETTPPYGHEATHIAEIRTPGELPDSWLGLSAMSVIVWGAGEPGEIRGPTARAMREWIERGGHLVIALPAAGQTWIGRAEHELSDMMPEVNVVRRDGVDMTAYTPLLTRARSPQMPTDGVIHEFVPRDGVAPEKAVRVINGPDGACIAVRRSWGGGAITVLGLDVGRQALPVDADVFWHRLIGTRGQLLNLQERTEADTRGGRWNVIANRNRPSEFDSLIGGMIDKKGQAATGILLGLVVFAAYWLVAGPVSYGVLKRMGLARHSWLAFVLSGAAFTVLAWGGAWLARPKQTEGTHLTVFETIHGHERVRSRSWVNVMIPWYGSATIAVGGADGRFETPGSRRDVRNTVAPWADIKSGPGSEFSFPDTREYALEAVGPGSVTFPARSTVKQFQIDWAGGTVWRAPFPAKPDGSAGGEIAVDAQGPIGLLAHGMPGALENVTIIYVPRASSVVTPSILSGLRPASEGAWAISLPASRAWRAGEVLNLRSEFAEVPLASRSLEALLDRLSVGSQYGNAITGVERVVAPEQYMLALALFNQLPGPATNATSSDQPRVIASRAAMHGWDICRWLTQPCLIVLGQVRESASPTPMFVDGEPMENTGVTWVRWVYPLPDNPPSFVGGSGGETESREP